MITKFYFLGKTDNDRTQSRREFINGTGILIAGSATGLIGCGGGGSSTPTLPIATTIKYGSREVPTLIYGELPTTTLASGTGASLSSVIIPGAVKVNAALTKIGSSASISVSLSTDDSLSASFLISVPHYVKSRISYGIEIKASSIQPSDVVVIDVTIPPTLVKAQTASIVAATSVDTEDGTEFLPSQSSVAGNVITVSVPASAFNATAAGFESHIVVAEVPGSRLPGSRPVTTDPDSPNRQLAVLNPPSSIKFDGPPITGAISITSRVGWRESTGMAVKDGSNHNGIDLGVTQADGHRALAVADGVILRVVNCNLEAGKTGQGNAITILHNGYVTQYLHLASFSEQIKAKIREFSDTAIYAPNTPNIAVKAGEVLGTVGNTAFDKKKVQKTSFPVHLHFTAAPTVPTRNWWDDSKRIRSVYNPEPLLQPFSAKLSFSQLVSEFLFIHGSVKYKSGDTLGAKVAMNSTIQLDIQPKDSVFRDLPIEMNPTLDVTVTPVGGKDACVEATYSAGKLNIKGLAVGTAKVRVSLKQDKSTNLAFSEILINVVGFTNTPPLIGAYKAGMIPISPSVKVGKTEVTVAMFKEYCTLTGKPFNKQAPSWGWVDSHPMMRVTWKEANDYAQWAGLRLPTKAEWTLAANGGTDRTYPWGNNWDESYCIKSAQSTAPVGSKPAGNTPSGICDLAGNVYEWNADGPSPGRYWARGGSWFNDDPNMYKCTYAESTADTTETNIGFRLVGP